ncbi:MFS transporter [Ammoniphilus resinae]|uniref:MFS family permease n=1 Tax=Ammoniphilus resinae TaxID=861532 RepID=A0ABS4GNE4_9BACL|nr:MFS transporter [Ammoniphilus resinae]MBP1931390.1 MFS family permease [Ammoniphilus resinae]
MKQETIWNRDFIGIWLSNFLTFMTFYSLVATLPIFVIDILKEGKEQIGPVMTSFLLAAVLSRPLAGRWLDQFGRKKILIASLALLLASTVGYLAVKGFFILLALRFLHGLGFGVATTATGSVAADLIPAKRKGEGIGYYALSMNTAMVFGPFLGLTLVQTFSFSVYLVVISIFSIVSFLVGSMVKTPIIAESKKEKKSLHWKTFIEPNAVPISLVSLLLSFAYSGLLTFIPVYALELDLSSYAGMFYLVYAVMMLVTRPFTGRMFDRFGEHVLVYPCIILYAIGLIALSQATTPFWFLFSGAIIGLGFGTLFPCVQTIAIMATPPARSGLATGTFFLFYDIGIGVGASILGTIASVTNYQEMYLISAVLVAVTALVYYAVYHRSASRKKVEELQLDV